jgi:hypothetical protein
MAKATDETPAVQVVTESFVIEVDGAPVAYLRGEPVEADDPVLRKHPTHFGPLVFPHPIRRRTHALGAPEVRAE